MFQSNMVYLTIKEINHVIFVFGGSTIQIHHYWNVLFQIFPTVLKGMVISLQLKKSFEYLTTHWLKIVIVYYLIKTFRFHDQLYIKCKK